MLEIYPEQLQSLLNRRLSMIYMLSGNDPFFLQESRDAIYQTAKNKGFVECSMFQINDNTDWKEIFYLCKKMSLFTKRRILHILFSKENSNIIVDKQLATIATMLHNDLLLIVEGGKLTKEKKKALYLSKLVNDLVLVICQTPEKENFLKWVSAKAEKNQLQLDETSCQTLCYYYEGNLLALSQILEQLAILYPNDMVTSSYVEKIINDVAYFTPFHWVDAVLLANGDRALRVLKHLRLEDNNLNTLLYIIERELLLLLNLKRQLTYASFRTLFDKYHILVNRRTMVTKALNRLTSNQLRQAIQLSNYAELMLRQNYEQFVWNKLESISLLLCNKPIADIFVNT